MREVQLSGRTQSRRQLGVIACIPQVKQVRIAESALGDLPGTEGIVPDEEPATAAPEENVAWLPMANPDCVVEIAADIDEVVLHGADADEHGERNVIKVRDVNHVDGELMGVLGCEHLVGGYEMELHAGIGSAFEEDEAGNCKSEQRAGQLEKVFVGRALVNPLDDGGLTGPLADLG